MFRSQLINFAKYYFQETSIHILLSMILEYMKKSVLSLKENTNTTLVFLLSSFLQVLKLFMT